MNRNNTIKGMLKSLKDNGCGNILCQECYFRGKPCYDIEGFNAGVFTDDMRKTITKHLIKLGMTEDELFLELM